MITLRHADTVGIVKEDVSEKNIKKIFYVFNQKFKDDPNTDDGYTVNTGLDLLPTLNSNEFNKAFEEAKKQGWRMLEFSGNYGTTTYKLIKL